MIHGSGRAMDFFCACMKIGLKIVAKNNIFLYFTVFYEN